MGEISKILKRGIISSYNIAGALIKRKYKNREIHPSANAARNRFYYFGIDDSLRVVDVANGTILKYVWVKENKLSEPVQVLRIGRRFKPWLV